jgi:hypothetical protein
MKRQFAANLAQAGDAEILTLQQFLRSVLNQFADSVHPEPQEALAHSHRELQIGSWAQQ